MKAISGLSQVMGMALARSLSTLSCCPVVPYPRDVPTLEQPQPNPSLDLPTTAADLQSTVDAPILDVGCGARDNSSLFEDFD